MIFYISLIVILVMFPLINSFNSGHQDYLFSNGDKVWFYDDECGVVKRLIIRNTMSGWDEDDWEYYNCIGPNYESDGNDIYEVSQKDLYFCKSDAELRMKKEIETLINHKEIEINKLKSKLA